MKVKGTQTTVESVEVTLSDEEVFRVANSLNIRDLAALIRGKLLDNFLLRVAGGRKGDFCITNRYWSDHVKGCPSTGKGTYLTLMERDADWDHHNNVGVDEYIRALTDDEAEQFRVINTLPDRIVEIYLQK